MLALSNDHQLIQSQIEMIVEERKLIKDSLTVSEGQLIRWEKKYERGSDGFPFRYFTKKKTLDKLYSEITKCKENIKAFNEQLDNLKIDVNSYYKGPSVSEYVVFLSQFESVCRSCKIWHITSKNNNTLYKSSAMSTIDRKEVSFFISELDFIYSKFKALRFCSLSGFDWYIYPSFILQVNLNSILFINLKDFSFIFKEQPFIEDEFSIPVDSKIINYTWERINKDGTPDLRYKGNHQKPVVRYGLFMLSSLNGRESIYHVSNYESAKTFADLFRKIRIQNLQS